MSSAGQEGVKNLEVFFLFFAYSFAFFAVAALAVESSQSLKDTEPAA